MGISELNNAPQLFSGAQKATMELKFSLYERWCHLMARFYFTSCAPRSAFQWVKMTYLYNRSPSAPSNPTLRWQPVNETTTASIHVLHKTHIAKRFDVAKGVGYHGCKLASLLAKVSAAELLICKPKFPLDRPNRFVDCAIATGVRVRVCVCGALCVHYAYSVHV